VNPIEPDLVRLRHHLHRHLERDYQQVQTAALLADRSHMLSLRPDRHFQRVTEWVPPRYRVELRWAS
jgi:metal-dependent amidase/aminoacylase/carboxypeptidase family protein